MTFDPSVVAPPPCTHTHTPAHPHTRTPTLVYDSGAVFEPSVLDISEDDLIKKFMEVSMPINQPCNFMNAVLRLPLGPYLGSFVGSS